MHSESHKDVDAPDFLAFLKSMKEQVHGLMNQNHPTPPVQTLKFDWSTEIINESST